MALADNLKSERLRQPTQQQARLASPTGGLNFLNSTMDFPDNDAYILDNIIPKPFGCEIRKGTRLWVPRANKFPAGVKTLMGYAGATRAISRLFACPGQILTGTPPPAKVPDKIYNVTTQNVAPILSLTASTNSDNPGEWYFVNFVTEGGNYLLACSAGAGLYKYDGTSWVEIVDNAARHPPLPTPPLTINNIYWPANYSVGGQPVSTKHIAFIWVWKGRIWFLMRNSSYAFYLNVGQMAGVAQPFDFGQQLNQGGSLLWASNWTYDSGSGIDDSLILASTEGQILVYEGTDPADATKFSLKGRWFAGRFPPGRRNFAEHGGQVHFLCEYGIVSISDLVSGRLHTAGLTGTVGAKINPRLSQLISVNLEQVEAGLPNVTSEYWFLQPYPTEEILIVGTPLKDTNTGEPQHLAMNSLTNAWCTFSGINMMCAEVFFGKYIYGTDDGLVIRGSVGYYDDVEAEPPTDPTASPVGDTVIARMQGAFYDYGNSNMNKRMLRIKVYGLSEADLAFFARFQPEYVLNKPIDAPPPRASLYPLWDNAIWDQSIWAEGDGSFHKWFGVNGFGKKMSLQLAIRGAGKVVYTDHETLFETGIGL